MNCPKCKNPIEDNVIICEWCGWKIISNQECNNNITEELIDLPVKWNGFITFWLVMMLISNIIITVIYMLPSSVIGSVFVLPDMRFIIANLVVINIFSTILLLRRIKLGFHIIVFIAFIQTILNIFAGYGIFSVLVGVLGVGVLFLILRIKKNGITGWKTLQQPNHKKNRSLYIIFSLILLVSIICSAVVYSDEKAGNEKMEYSIFIPKSLNSASTPLGIAYQNATQTVIVNIIEEKKRDLRHLSISNLSSYADYLQNVIKQKGVVTLDHKVTQINGLSAILYRYRFNDRYGNMAYIEMGNSYYQVIIEVLFKDRYEYQNEIDEIIYSFKNRK